ncbi:hypothetical protein D9611_012845 [Ephemerocybe angulata]|uniref:Uncharacterized protein n=1 Tax=Ephemerocybe angulata TaxID=980116 RepID=A0A8H5BAP6_9AGAR|nr:hypothetical protein D9611_012845 [Tulosesus angulatus]
MKSFSFIAAFLLVVVSPIFVLARPIITEVPEYELISRDEDDQVYALISRNVELAEDLVRNFDALMERRGARAVTPKRASNTAQSRSLSRKPRTSKSGRPKGSRSQPQISPSNPGKYQRPVEWPVGPRPNPNARPPRPAPPPPKPSVGARIVNWAKEQWNKIKPRPRQN